MSKKKFKLKLTITILLTIFVLILVIANLPNPSKAPTFSGDLNKEISKLRNNYDLPPLEETAELNNIASIKCNDMANNDYYGHKDLADKYIWQTMSYQYTKAGENLARGLSTASAVVKAWRDSPEHLANITNTSYSMVGYAVCKDKTNNLLVVQELKG